MRSRERGRRRLVKELATVHRGEEREAGMRRGRARGGNLKWLLAVAARGPRKCRRWPLSRWQASARPGMTDRGPGARTAGRRGEGRRGRGEGRIYACVSARTDADADVHTQYMAVVQYTACLGDVVPATEDTRRHGWARRRLCMLPHPSPLWKLRPPLPQHPSRSAANRISLYCVGGDSPSCNFVAVYHGTYSTCSPQRPSPIKRRRHRPAKDPIASQRAPHPPPAPMHWQRLCRASAAPL
ncbi:hypothetical protein K505DRAFT_15625 [Melanomma pulvis-pyrius CBS 109.77]|uniref:Uncharacterized protein n=1 Tax=Melanomma pulvis-pyrius CBS 109.77 TaxID=1314802 RepID=A0A6A6XFW4_9PLEO|nr:hypothetical protein K505DRAFT_15625 [Melanomma pulvis-pyrius CBS 109.77]